MNVTAKRETLFTKGLEVPKVTWMKKGTCISLTRGAKKVLKVASGAVKWE